MGDSFTEGVGDPRSDGDVRGWADLVAQGLADVSGEDVGYANLAVRGRRLAPIVDDQIPAALALDPPPTVVTMNGGGNDILGRDWDLDTVRRRTESALIACVDAGVSPILLSGPDPSASLPFGRTIRGRGARLTEALAEMADRCGVTFVDLFGTAELRDPAYWSSDRLHLNPRGHQRVADHVLAAVCGRPVAGEENLQARSPGRLDGLAFTVGHLLPWVLRHATGRSSGDGRSPKHPDWVAVAPAT
ncbi:SGNH/GDSL hydrolase family protein [Gordonia sp. VNK21]|uniref:SGNH/GDSL hydrolase family protein n=1 Tax=Gordonia sp. VNK21 TaxID=3382483 RepID=UPI0038D3F2C5